MQATTFCLETHDGVAIFTYRWRPGKPAKAVVRIAHGWAEHAGRYARVAEALGREGYVVYANDHRGHERTARTPAEIASSPRIEILRETGYPLRGITSIDAVDWAGGRTPQMSDRLPVVYLVRHGGTAWTISHQHTGRTDLPLTPQGEAEATRLGQRLQGLTFAAVRTSPLRRAIRTCELAGFGPAAEIEANLVEWNYGAYEGRTSAEIHAERPDWQLFRDGAPEGESPDQIGARADRVIGRVRAIEGNTLLFSSGHFLRVFAARWLGLEPGAGRYLFLGTASLSALGYEHDHSDPVIRLWNETPHEPPVSRAPVRVHREKARR